MASEMARQAMKMVEKIARAMAERNWPGASKSDIDEMWGGWIEEAQAALAAMETPTPEMRLAGAQAITLEHMKKAANYDAACDAWSAMIAKAREG